jgi:hypothetical protein
MHHDFNHFVIYYLGTSYKKTGSYDAEIFRISLTILSRIDIVWLVIVLWKLAKPTGVGEPAGLSLFLFYRGVDEVGKDFLTFTQQVEYLHATPTFPALQKFLSP